MKRVTALALLLLVTFHPVPTCALEIQSKQPADIQALFGMVASAGRINAVVSKSIDTQLQYNASGIEPEAALADIAQQVGGQLHEVQGTSTRTFLLLAASEPVPDIPASAPGSQNISVRFRLARVSHIVDTIAHHGQFHASVDKAVDANLGFALRDVTPLQALHLTAAMAGAVVVEYGSGQDTIYELVPRKR
jgi:hypothetical protein